MVFILLYQAGLRSKLDSNQNSCCQHLITINIKIMNFRKIALICFCATAFTACKKDKENPQGPSMIDDSFESTAKGWIVDFADYPLSPDSVKYNLDFGITNLPSPLDVSKKGLRVSGKNHSDDLFMFLKKKVSGLKPNTSYRFNFEVALASDAPSGLAGIGRCTRRIRFDRRRRKCSGTQENRQGRIL